MTFIRYRQAWPTQARMHDDFRRIFDRFVDGDSDSRNESSTDAGQWAPRVDIEERPECFVIFADLPGVDPQDVEVLMDRGVLSIKGERKREIEEQGGRFYRVERRHGGFERRFSLPDTADAEGITAQGRNGVLEIAIPKRPQTTPRRIQVGAGAA